MIFLRELGDLAFATRLRLIFEKLYSDLARIYREEGIDFEPKYFAIVYLLKRKGSSNISSIAEEIGITQPAVSQLINLMHKKDLISIKDDKKDTRKKIISLSQKTKKMLPGLEIIWNNVTAVHDEIYSETGANVLDVLSRLERVLENKGLYPRLKEKLQHSALEAVTILDYKPELKKYFKTLNYEWLKRYFTIEKYDDRILSDPDKEIIGKGGFIQFAKYKNDVVGTCAMIRINTSTYELSKMAVEKNYRGRGIGKKLACSVMEKAYILGSKKVILHTSPLLVNAVSLYRKLGFVKKPEPSPNIQYKRDSIFMELELKKYFETLKYQ